MKKMATLLTLMALAGCVSTSISPSALDTTYTIAVDYQKPLETIVQDCGFDWANANIIGKNFPNPSSINAQLIAVLVQLGPLSPAEDVERKLSPMGYRPATLFELLAFAKAYPDAQLDRLIVALGSHCQLASSGSRPSTTALSVAPLTSGSASISRNAPKTFYPFLSNELGKAILDLADAELIHPRSTTNSSIFALFILKQ